MSSKRKSWAPVEEPGSVQRAKRSKPSTNFPAPHQDTHRLYLLLAGEGSADVVSCHVRSETSRERRDQWVGGSRRFMDSASGCGAGCGAGGDDGHAHGHVDGHSHDADADAVAADDCDGGWDDADVELEASVDVMIAQVVTVSVPREIKVGETVSVIYRRTEDLVCEPGLEPTDVSVVLLLPHGEGAHDIDVDGATKVALWIRAHEVVSVDGSVDGLYDRVKAGRTAGFSWGGYGPDDERHPRESDIIAALDTTDAELLATLNAMNSERTFMPCRIEARTLTVAA